MKYFTVVKQFEPQNIYNSYVNDETSKILTT